MAAKIRRPQPRQRNRATTARGRGGAGTRQEIGIAEGAVDPNRAGTDRGWIRPARQFLGGGIQLPDRQHAAEQTSGQQGCQQPIPPQDIDHEQPANQGKNPDIAQQLEQALGCCDRYR